MTDVTAFERLWLRSESLLTNYARKIADYRWITSEDIRDLIQQTRIKSFTAFDQFDRAKSFESWVCQIYLNVYRDCLRRQKSHLPCFSLSQNLSNRTGRTGGCSHLEIADSRPDPERGYLDSCLSEELSAALDYLPSERRLAIVLLSEGWSYEEIAEKTGVELGTVRSRIHRARKQLRRFQLRVGVVHQPSSPPAR